ncbi:DUF445 domain-containing protein [Niabella beijingensis]|uniref:DUF445 domain-containing protein n=1 Tax=Niabella beijingensis TaxID=2872700 RepID=UPI001CBFED53|nr:DUF445 domain-containing protein [Niabella beijingensis]MBZ4187966.1 DUF445 domain-containing protein [Niabella beijingensis]
MSNAINSTDAIKAAQLRKHKTLATGLFLLMMAVFLVCVYLLKTKTDVWIGYVKAFAEAAMVGALADWFAVTALFHHPLGLPIPHTNLIENSKKSIGDNLGDFVVSNFLTAKTLRPYIDRLELSTVTAAWLAKAQNVELLVGEASRLLKRMVETSDAAMITGFIARKAGSLLEEVRLNEVVANGLNLIIDRGDHERVLNFVLVKVRNYVIENEALVKQRVKEQSHFLIPGFVNNYIAAKLTSGIATYLQEIEKDPQHRIRKDFNKQLRAFTETLKTSPEWQRDLDALKQELLTRNKLEQYAGAIWKRLQAQVLQDLSAEDSALRKYFKKSVEELAASLQHDPQMRVKIDSWIRYNAYNYILRNTKQAGILISSTVGNWEGKELSNKLELEVGKDLQFIRINGTLVGGIVGLLIYTLSRLL